MYEKCQSGSRQRVAPSPVFTENKTRASNYLICVLIHRALFNVENHIDRTVSDCQTYFVG